jgi:hypothetical protein
MTNRQRARRRLWRATRSDLIVSVVGAAVIYLAVIIMRWGTP